MKIVDRKTLKGFFEKGKMPTQSNFEYLIDSTLNKVEDGFSRSGAEGFQLAPETESGNLISLYRSGGDIKEQIDPQWFVSLKKNTSNPQDQQPPSDLFFGNSSDETGGLYLQRGGNIGIGTHQPQASLDVQGEIWSTGRRGNYTDKNIDPTTVLADGKWHRIVTNLDGLHAFEVMASASGPKGQGKYALIHATALSAYGNSNSSIQYTSANYKGWFLKLQLRWTGSTNDYHLEIRTKKSFGAGVKIKYSITQLYSEI